MPNFDKLKDQIEMTITAEGLRIEMMETETATFFDVGSPRPNGTGKELFVLLAQELGRFPTEFPSKATPIHGLLPNAVIMETGSCPSIARTQPDD